METWDYYQSSEIRSSFPALKEGIISFYLLYSKAANLDFCMGWDLVIKVERGATLKQNPKTAATRSHQNWHLRADSDLTVNVGLNKAWQALIRAFFKLN